MSTIESAVEHELRHIRRLVSTRDRLRARGASRRDLQSYDDRIRDARRRLGEAARRTLPPAA